VSKKQKDPAIAKFRDRISGQGEQVPELVPAATVILLRDTSDGLETLMLRKNSRISFGGMWVFPGGKIDSDDGEPDAAMESRARVAAAREAREETGLAVEPGDMVWFSHWTPPPMGNRRFATWFYAAPAPAVEVTIDQGEIIESRWISAIDAMAQQASGEIELAPPTYVTLHYLSRYSDTSAALSGLGAGEPRHYATHIASDGEDVVALWEGDAGYEQTDASVPGPRHRLHLRKGGFVFEDSALLD
jgi:8-oxo-dGTP pyrophosphatase MutT (NUDIX family)